MNKSGDRKSFRAQWHHYNDGIYFITICTDRRRALFGQIIGDSMLYTELGKIVAETISDLPNHPPYPEILNSVVMPNHVHIMVAVGARPAAPAEGYVDEKVEGKVEGNLEGNVEGNGNQTSEIGNLASGIVSTKMGCLKPPKHGDACDDFHHNSLLAVIVGGLKSAVTRKYNRLLQDCNQSSLVQRSSLVQQSSLLRPRQWARQAAPPPGERIWQRLYHEHIVRTQRAFDNIMRYIDNNVANWSNDCFF